MGKQVVYFFEGKPTIGFCAKCEETATYVEGKGLVCPNDEKHEISIFEYTGEGPDPAE